MNNQISPFENVSQGKKLCSYDTNILFIWADLSDKGSDENRFEPFGFSNAVLCC